jgi:hypothetical protein
VYETTLDFPGVTDVRYQGGYTLWLRFSDGVEGEVDLRDWLEGPAFEALRDVTQFGRARVGAFGTIIWPNGTDVSPEALYDRLRVSAPVVKKPYTQLFDDAARREAHECAAMPEISRFLGMVIHMFWKELEAPHFHARYGEFVASIDIATGAVTTRRFPARALRLLEEWRELHEAELRENWERLRRHEAPNPIDPLE